MTFFLTPTSQSPAGRGRIAQALLFVGLFYSTSAGGAVWATNQVKTPLNPGSQPSTSPANLGSTSSSTNSSSTNSSPICGVNIANQADITYGEGISTMSGRSNLINLGSQRLESLVQIQLSQIRTGDNGTMLSLPLGQLTASLQKLGYTETEAITGTTLVATSLGRQAANATPEQYLATARAALSQAVPGKSNLLENLPTDLQTQIQALGPRLAGNQDFRIGTQKGNQIFHEVLLTNYSTQPQILPLKGMPDTLVQQVTLPARSQVRLTLTLTLETTPTTGGLVDFNITLKDQALQLTLSGVANLTAAQTTVLAANPNAPILGNCAPVSLPIQSTFLIPPPVNELVDPIGRLTGCDGELLPDYRGFSVGLYNPNPADPTGGITSLVSLLPTGTGTSLLGMAPNLANSNPFFLSGDSKGEYNFLLDANRGQLDVGDTYILLVNPPSGSGFGQRRIRLVITARTGNQVAYQATALDGQSIRTSDGATSINGTVTISDAATVGLVLALVSLNTNLCQTQEIQINKTGDRVSAQPGDTVIYRLGVKNLATIDLNNLQITDTLPLGFSYRPDSLRAELGGQRIAVNAIRNGSTLVITAPGVVLPVGQILNIAYAATLTPDAIRGSGENVATVQGQRTQPPLRIVRDGPAVFRVRPRAGMFFDGGTIIGRVFEDRNRDGEQQKGEPGIANAVIFLNDGNQITTDANGLFSVANVLPGYHTGVLDLSSVPGYTFDPNPRFKERNSQSRLVQLAPGGMVRMNFGIVPIQPVFAPSTAPTPSKPEATPVPTVKPDAPAPQVTPGGQP